MNLIGGRGNHGLAGPKPSTMAAAMARYWAGVITSDPAANEQLTRRLRRVHEIYRDLHFKLITGQATARNVEWLSRRFPAAPKILGRSTRGRPKNVHLIVYLVLLRAALEQANPNFAHRGWAKSFNQGTTRRVEREEDGQPRRLAPRYYRPMTWVQEVDADADLRRQRRDEEMLERERARNKQMVRACICCLRPFASRSATNRICPKCVKWELGEEPTSHDESYECEPAEFERIPDRGADRVLTEFERFALGWLRMCGEEYPEPWSRHITDQAKQLYDSARNGQRDRR